MPNPSLSLAFILDKWPLVDREPATFCQDPPEMEQIPRLKPAAMPLPLPLHPKALDEPKSGQSVPAMNQPDLLRIAFSFTNPKRKPFQPPTYFQKRYPPPPLQTPGLARDGLPGGGGRRSPSDGLPGGGGDCKGISRQTVVPSTNASKENTCEATFALMPMCFIQHKCY